MKNGIIAIFSLTVIVLVAAWGVCSLCGVNCKENAQATIQKLFATRIYRVTCFVQEVLEDGTLSYARVYETSHYPTHPENRADRIRIRLDNGEEIMYHGPYTIEAIIVEQN